MTLLPDGWVQLGAWQARISGLRPESPLVSVCLRKTVELNFRLDTGKGVFLDEEYILPADLQVPAFMVVLLAHISELRKSDSDKTIERLTRENEDLKTTIQMMQGPPSTREEECFGGCSRGGDGPACRKRGCRG